MTKRDLVIRISNETGLVQQQVLDVVQKTLDYIAEAVARRLARTHGEIRARHNELPDARALSA